MFVWISGKIDYFCSNRCEKNLLKLHRKPLQTKWTDVYRKEHKKGVKERSVKEGTAGSASVASAPSSDLAAPA